MPGPCVPRGPSGAASTASFLRASAVREHFLRSGAFLGRKGFEGEGVRCTSARELLSHAAAESFNTGVRQRVPDAVFVAMNPGSSRPLRDDGTEGAQLLGPTPGAPWPGRTQYRAMRAVSPRGWSHARAVHLSGTREPASAACMQRFQGLEGEAGFCAHSILAPAHRAEFARELQRREGAPLGRAWGVHPVGLPQQAA